MRNPPTCLPTKSFLLVVPYIRLMSSLYRQRAVSESRAVTRTIYALFADGIISDSGSIKSYFTVSNPTNLDVHYFRNAMNVLRFIYCSDQYIRYDVTFHSKSSIHHIKDSTTLFKVIIIPWLKNSELVSPTTNQYDSSKLRAVLREVADTIRNETLSIQQYHSMRQSLISTYPKCNNLCDCIQLMHAINPSQLEYLLTALSSISGHRFHPMAKTKLNVDPPSPLSIDQIRNYCPEFGKSIPIYIVAVHSTYCRVHGIDSDHCDAHHVFKSHFHDEYNNWCHALKGIGKNPLDFTPIPVHELQIDHIRREFADLIASESLMILPETVHIECKASMSFRTMIPVESTGMCPHLKLPINIQATSEIRNQNPLCVAAGPILSRMVGSILDSDPELNTLIDAVLEVHGVSIDPKHYDSDQYQHRGYKLDVIYRQNPNLRTLKDEIRLPLNMIFDRSPFTNRVNIIDIIERAVDGEKEKMDAIWKWICKYIGIMIDGQIGMMAKHGILFESHQQNTMIIFDAKRWTPKRSLNRDIAHGIWVDAVIATLNGYLNEEISGSLIRPKKFIDFDGLSSRRMMMHTLFMSHLVPFVFVIINEYEGISEARCFAFIRKCIRECIDGVGKSDKVRKSELYRQRLDQMESYLLGRCMENKKLFSMRLRQSMQELYSETSNALKIGETECNLIVNSKL